MHLILNKLFSIIIVILTIETLSEIPNCAFINTFSIIDKNKSYIENNIENEKSQDLESFYDFEILSNGTRVSVAKHKRGCICFNPCISICSAQITTIYEDPNFTKYFLKNITFQNDVLETKDIYKDFKHRFDTPCDISEIYPVEDINDPRDKWILFENGTLLIPYYKSYRNQQQYCFDWVDYVNPENESEIIGGDIVPYICPLNNDNYEADKYKSWAMLCSIPFFLMTIFFYYLRPELRNKHTLCFVMYLIYLTITYSLICFITLSPECSELECITIGYIIYFGTIGFLTWISIVSFDTFSILTGLDCIITLRSYFKMGIIIPTIATFLLFVIQSLDINENWKPGIERGNCGVNNTRWSALIYYYIPHILVLIFCLTLYIILIRYLVVNERAVTAIASRMKNSHVKRFSLYFRLFVFMGVVWFLEILSYFMDMISEGKNKFTIIPDLFNALHGIFVFISTVMNTSNCRYIKKRFLPKRYIQHDLVTKTSTEGLSE